MTQTVWRAAVEPFQFFTVAHVTRVRDQNELARKADEIDLTESILEEAKQRAAN